VWRGSKVPWRGVIEVHLQAVWSSGRSGDLWNLCLKLGKRISPSRSMRTGYSIWTPISHPRGELRNNLGDLPDNLHSPASSTGCQLSCSSIGTAPWSLPTASLVLGKHPLTETNWLPETIMIGRADTPPQGHTNLRLHVPTTAHMPRNERDSRRMTRPLCRYQWLRAVTLSCIRHECSSAALWVHSS
jgi:hypothetical protein